MDHHHSILVVFLFLAMSIDHLSCQDGRVKTTCYDKPPIGCFSNKYPHNNTDSKPDKLSKFNLHYVHYVGTDSRRFFWEDAKDVMKSRFRKDLKTCMIVHGWLEHDHKPWVITLVQELIRKEPMNLIIVDWEGGARVRKYLQGIANGRVVGAMVGLFLKDLKGMGADLSTFHLIGNSLGAHICGHIGANAPGIGRITGMDPSGRNMEDVPPEARLDPSDAKVVDVIHTDGTDKLGFGSLKPMGTIDFYVNGGLDQPGCATRRIAVLFAMVFRGLGFNKCSHSRANILFTKSIRECTIMAEKCDKLSNALDMECNKCKWNKPCAKFGYSLSKGAKGIYSFKTKESPLCESKASLLDPTPEANIEIPDLIDIN